LKKWASTCGHPAISQRLCLDLFSLVYVFYVRNDSMFNQSTSPASAPRPTWRQAWPSPFTLKEVGFTLSEHTVDI
jgi:hypothetical protein